MASKKSVSKRSRSGKSTKKTMKKTTRAMIAMLVTIFICAAMAGGMYLWKQEEVRAEEQRQAEIRAAEEEAARLAEEAARKAEEERLAAEEAARKAEEEARRKAEEEEARRIAEEEARKKAEEEAARKAEEELLAAHPELKSAITYILPIGNVTLDRDTLITWLEDNGDGTYTKNEDTWYTKVSQYVATMAAGVDSRNKDRIFNTTGLGEIVLNTGSYYGWEIDEAAEIQKLLSELAEGTVTTREPVYLSRESAKKDDNNGIGQNYLEADLSRQHLWIYKAGQLAFETDIVSGLMDEAHYTPPGVYLLLKKETNATLLGMKLPNGEYSYEAPVSYWMPFTEEGHGLHDASWKWAFGGEEYIWNGSHGCINLPLDAAGVVYDLMTTEMPLVIYYSQYFELRPAPPSEYDQYVAAMQAAAEESDEDEEEKRREEEEEERRRQEEEQRLQEEQAAAEEAARIAAEEQAAAEQAAAEAAWAEQDPYQYYEYDESGYDEYNTYDEYYYEEDLW